MNGPRGIQYPSPGGGGVGSGFLAQHVFFKRFFAHAAPGFSHGNPEPGGLSPGPPPSEKKRSIRCNLLLHITKEQLREWTEEAQGKRRDLGHVDISVLFAACALGASRTVSPLRRCTTEKGRLDNPGATVNRKAVAADASGGDTSPAVPGRLGWNTAGVLWARIHPADIPQAASPGHLAGHQTSRASPIVTAVILSPGLRGCPGSGEPGRAVAGAASLIPPLADDPCPKIRTRIRGSCIPGTGGARILADPRCNRSPP